MRWEWRKEARAIKVAVAEGGGRRIRMTSSWGMHAGGDKGAVSQLAGEEKKPRKSVALSTAVHLCSHPIYGGRLSSSLFFSCWSGSGLGAASWVVATKRIRPPPTRFREEGDARLCCWLLLCPHGWVSSVSLWALACRPRPAPSGRRLCTPARCRSWPWQCVGHQISCLLNKIKSPCHAAFLFCFKRCTIWRRNKKACM
jgi:hypothetical protein